MDINHLKERLNSEEAAKYLDCARGSLPVWRSLKRHDLKPEKRGRKIFYERSQLDQALGDNGSGPVLNLKNAARFIGQSPETLRKRMRRKEPDFKPGRLGRSLRFRISELARYKEEHAGP